MRAVSLFLILAMCGQALPTTTKAADYHVFFGTYTSGKSEGIYRSSFDSSSGALSDAVLAAKTQNPSFLTIRGQHLFAVNELTNYEGKASGAVTAYQLDATTGDLAFINQQASGGGAPCHIVIDATGKHVLLANYVGGNVGSLPILENGRLGRLSSLQQHQGASVNSRRQKEPHAHSINLDAANRFAFAADLGADRIFAYAFNAESGALTPHQPATSLKPGSGPRHFVFHPQGSYAYVINELLLTITAFRYDAERGELRELQTISTLPKSVKERKGSTAEVRITPDGRFLYGSNRGHDTIAMFAVDPKTGRLKALGHQPTGGRTPRNFNVSPDGKFLFAANQSTHNVVLFRIDQQSGLLQGVGRSIYVPNPVCVRFAQVAD